MAAVGFTVDAVNVTIRWLRERKKSLIEEDEHGLPLSYKMVWILGNINSSLSLMITLGEKSLVFEIDWKAFLSFQFTGHCFTTP